MPEIKIGGLTLEDFAAEIVVAKGLVEANRKAQGAYQHRLVVEAEEATQRAMVEALSEEQATELMRKLDAGASDEEIEQFFANAGVDYESAVKAALEKFRKEKLAEEVTIAEKPAQLGEEPVGGRAAAEDVAPAGAQPVQMAQTAPVTPTAQVAQSTQATPVMENKNRGHDNLGGNNSSNQAPAQGVVSQAQGASDVEGRPLVRNGATLINQQATTTHDVHVGVSGPVQGTASESQGTSDVEGRALAQQKLTEER